MTHLDEDGPGLEGDDALAAEYVLGVLPAEERQTVAARIAREPAFARLVEAWEERLSPINAGYEEHAPPPGALAAIQSRLFAEPQAARSPGFWSSLAFWRGLSAAALAGLLLLIALPFIRPEPAVAPAERLVASLSAEDSDVRYVAVYDGASGEIALSHLSGEHGPDRDFELWVIAGDEPPASLGLVPGGRTVSLPAGQGLREKIEAGSLFAISLEPAGGSPTGAPTGPVVATGDLRAI